MLRATVYSKGTELKKKKKTSPETYPSVVLKLWPMLQYSNNLSVWSRYTRHAIALVYTELWVYAAEGVTSRVNPFRIILLSHTSTYIHRI